MSEVGCLTIGGVLTDAVRELWKEMFVQYRGAAVAGHVRHPGLDNGERAASILVL